MTKPQEQAKQDSKGFQRYQETILDFSTEYLEPAWQARKNKTELPASPTDALFSTVFYGFTEIVSTIDALKLCQTLIRVAPPRSKAILPDEYFKFLVGAYFQEMYILGQRLDTYAKRMSRLYRKPQILPIVNEHILSPLSGINRTRGAHVHAQRYTDKDLDMLSTYSLLSRHDAEFADHLEDQYWLAQREWGEKVKNNNAAVKILADRYFDLLYPVVTKDGEFFLPRTGRGRKAKDV